MSGRTHHYATSLEWTGDKGTGTSGYRDYARDHVIRGDGKPDLAGSSDPVFRGDPARWNPEELLVAALSSCHLLAYLHLCAVDGVVVTGYTDDAGGEMAEDGAGGRFTRVTLRPKVTIAAGDPDRAQALHHEAHAVCFIANSVNFPVECEPSVEVRG